VIEDTTGTQLYGAHPSTGVDFRPMSSTDGDKKEDYAIEMPDDTKQLIIKNLLSQRGRPYDYSAIIGFAIHRDWRSPAKWFCSELQTWAAEVSAFPLLRTNHLNRISPNDLLLCPYLHPVT
jgi:hypothetical protein